MSLRKIISWSLITVSYGGVVAHSHGFPTLELCEEAKSLALTGMTTAQNLAADQAHQEAVEEAARIWREAHPPRAPTEEDREQCRRIRWSSSLHCTIGEDGLLYEWPGTATWMSPTYSSDRGEGVKFVRGQWSRKHAFDIKLAECVPVFEGAT